LWLDFLGFLGERKEMMAGGFGGKRVYACGKELGVGQ
jgi:hypothetical protein